MRQDVSDFTSSGYKIDIRGLAGDQTEANVTDSSPVNSCDGNWTCQRKKG